MPISITSENFDEEITKSTLPIILDVYAPWCGPCQYMTPIFEELENELSNKYKFAKLNIDEERDIAVQYQVSSIPTFIFIKKGQIVGRETGYMDKETLKGKIKTFLG
jgi:thioredoxin 1